MILKSYGRRYGVWFGIGHQSKVTWPITRSWLTTVLPPYLHGVGLNFSVGHWSFRVGAYKVIAGYVSDEYDDVDVEGELAVLGWRLVENTPEVIRTWDSTKPSDTLTESRPQPAPPAAAPEIEPSVSTTLDSSTGLSPSP